MSGPVCGLRPVHVRARDAARVRCERSDLCRGKIIYIRNVLQNHLKGIDLTQHMMLDPNSNSRHTNEYIRKT